MLAEMIQRLFERQLDLAVQARAREGEWLADLWAEVAEMGLPLALLSEDEGGFGLSPAETGEVLRQLGLHAVPLPVAETMGANRLLAKAGLPLAEGPAGLARADDLAVEQGRIKGVVTRVAWGADLDCLALAVGIEYLQLFFPPRTVSLNDLLAEGLGTVAIKVGDGRSCARHRLPDVDAVRAWLAALAPPPPAALPAAIAPGP